MHQSEIRDKTVLHRRKKRAQSEPPTRQLAHPLPPPESCTASDPLPHLEIERYARRSAVRSKNDDWHSGVTLHWGLPNALLGYNETSKQRFDKAVQQQRRNLRLMQSFAFVDETVSALLQLLQMETAAVLTQTPDRAYTHGAPFTMKTFVNHALNIDRVTAGVTATASNH